MKILISMGHPAHFHLFKQFINQKKIEHTIKIVIKEKDILKQLLNNAGYDYEIINDYKFRRKGKLIGVLNCDRNLFSILKDFKPDISLGSTIEIGHIGKLFRIPSIFFAEDDIEIMPIFNVIGYPFIKTILCPEVTSTGIWYRKTIKYSGYHELAYLSPKYFKPQSDLINKDIDLTKRFFILRFAKLVAHHDKGIQGFRTDIAQQIINILKSHGNIYITSERKLESQFEKYRININPLDMHHLLAFANLYIGDSQTMAAESGVLGIPFIRFNDFVGRIGYLNELENKYELGYGFKTNQVKEMIAKIKELLSIPNLKQEFQERREKMLSEKIDVTDFMVWFIENYPGSVKIMKENPDYQYRFK